MKQNTNDLISREKALALIRAESDIAMQNWKEHDDECSYGEMCAHDRDVDILQSLPSAQPEIIRCKDCFYFEIDECNEQDWCHAWGDGTIEDGFCNYAERRYDG